MTQSAADAELMGYVVYGIRSPRLHAAVVTGVASGAPVSYSVVVVVVGAFSAVLRTDVPSPASAAAAPPPSVALPRAHPPTANAPTTAPADPAAWRRPGAAKALTTPPKVPSLPSARLQRERLESSHRRRASLQRERLEGRILREELAKEMGEHGEGVDV
jgi:hypothetical protein